MVGNGKIRVWGVVETKHMAKPMPSRSWKSYEISGIRRGWMAAWREQRKVSRKCIVIVPISVEKLVERGHQAERAERAEALGRDYSWYSFCAKRMGEGACEPVWTLARCSPGLTSFRVGLQAIIAISCPELVAVAILGFTQMRMCGGAGAANGVDQGQWHACRTETGQPASDVKIGNSLRREEGFLTAAKHRRF
jgi:hypothetical protein